MLTIARAGSKHVHIGGAGGLALVAAPIVRELVMAATTGRLDLPPGHVEELNEALLRMNACVHPRWSNLTEDEFWSLIGYRGDALPGGSTPR